MPHTQARAQRPGRPGFDARHPLPSDEMLTELAELTRPKVQKMHNHLDLSAQLDDLADRMGRPPRGQLPAAAPRWTPRDFTQAHGEALWARLHPGAPTEHPLAAGAIEQPLVGLSARYLTGLGVPARDERELLAAGGPGSAHLSEVLADVAQRLTLARGPALADVVTSCTRTIELRDFRPARVAEIDVDAAHSMPTTQEFKPYTTVAFRGDGIDLALCNASLRVRFAEQLIVNDDANVLQRVVDGVTNLAAQNEEKATINLLLANPPLGDGMPLFGDDNTAGRLTEAGLTDAMHRLRATLANGMPSGAQARILVAGPGNEFLARKVIAGLCCGSEPPPIRVVVSPWLVAGDPAFLLADPAIWPVLVRGVLRGSGGHSLHWYPGVPDHREGSRDLVLIASHTVAFGALSRVGAVRLLPD